MLEVKDIVILSVDFILFLSGYKSLLQPSNSTVVL